MKKNFAFPSVRPFPKRLKEHRTIETAIKFMRLSFYVLLIVSISTQLLSASVLKGQNLSETQLKIELKNESLDQALEKIQRKTKFRFAFKPADLRDVRNISIPYQQRSVKGTLDLILSGTGITYIQLEGNILLSRKNGETKNVDEAFRKSVPNVFPISGNVTDEKGITLNGVSVMEKGTSNGAVTDVNGSFKLNVSSENAILVFSYIGYTPKELPLSGQKNVKVILMEDNQSLNDVVVIGYGTAKKSDLTGSVATISAKDFNKGAITSPQDLIAGKIAGVVITSAGGAPGGASNIRIRGGSSLSASNDPLIVIDGVPVSNSWVSGLSNPLSSINPQDIETFTVLKDASATAIYGSRASNGVILITTKKGGKELKLGYSANASLYTLPNRIDVLSPADFRSMILQRQPAVANLLGNSETDWQNEIYHTAFGQEHNLSASGSTSWSPYRISLGLSDQDGLLKTSSFERSALGINLNPSFLKNHLNINLNLKGSYNKTRFAPTGAINSAIIFDPTQPIKNGGIYQQGYFAYLTGSSLNGLAPSNPVALLELTDNRAKVYRTLGSIQTDYKFHFLPELRANLNIAYDYSKSNGNSFTPSGTSFTTAFEGNNQIYTQEQRMNLAEFYLNYAKDIKTIAGKIDATAGYSYQHFKVSSFNNATSADGTKSLSQLSSKTQNYLISFFGRLNYSALNRYLFTFTIRNDGSSRFSPENRWGLFPSAAFAWRINEEHFLKDNTIISDLKLRIGYGETGQQDIGEDYPYLAKYTKSSPDGSGQYQFGNTFYNTLRPSGYDEHIKWESTTTYNAAIDFGLFRNRLTGSLDIYQRKTSDLLNTIPVPAGTNLSNYITTNVGDLENRGIELSLNGRLIEQEDFSWEIAYNIGINKSKILKLTQTDDPKYIGVQTGAISGSTTGTVQINSVGYPVNSFYVYKQIYENGLPKEGAYEDLNGDGIVNSSDSYRYRKAAPTTLMGISSRLTYKNWDFSFSGRASFSNYVYNNVNSSYGTFFDIYSLGALKNVTSSVAKTNFLQRQLFSDYYIENASFFRMDNISLSRRFPKLFGKRSSLNISAVVQNAFVISNYSGLDPEVFNGIDNTVYPRPRTYVIGASINF